MSVIYSASCSANPQRDMLRVSGRHTKPVTDELLVSHLAVTGQRSVLLNRTQVRELHAVLGRWLADGWPGVARTETPAVPS